MPRFAPITKHANILNGQPNTRGMRLTAKRVIENTPVREDSEDKVLRVKPAPTE